MRDSVQDLVGVIDALISHAAASTPDRSTVDAMNEMLSTGYVRALQCDGETRRIERRLRQLAAEDRGRSTDEERDALVLARRHRIAEAVYLRAKLDVLRSHFTRLREAA